MPLYDHPEPDWDKIRQIAEAQYQAQMVQRSLSEPICKWTGFRLVAACSGCQIETSAEVGDLTPRWGDRFWSSVIERLRCKACGSRPGTMTLKHHIAKWQICGDNPGWVFWTIWDSPCSRIN
jgi:hypothetical protein